MCRSRDRSGATEGYIVHAGLRATAVPSPLRKCLTSITLYGFLETRRLPRVVLAVPVSFAVPSI